MDEVTRLSQELAQYKERVTQECGQKIQEILQEHKCTLVATPQIQDGRIVAIIQVVVL